MRIIIAGLIGGIVLFIWGFVWWAMLSTVVMPYTPATDEAAVMDVMMENMPESGMYWLPAMPEGIEQGSPKWDAFIATHEAGPIAMVYFSREGRTPMAPMDLLRGVVINIISVTIAAALLMLAAGGRGYALRVVFVLGLGLFLCAAVYLVDWNFMNMPTQLLAFRIMDSLIGWLLVGLIIAAIVKRPSAVVSQNEW